MKILFLGDIVGDSGCIAVKKHLQLIIENVYNHLKKFPQGRLIYCGAGTSGRVAIQAVSYTHLTLPTKKRV